MTYQFRRTPAPEFRQPIEPACEQPLPTQVELNLWRKRPQSHARAMRMSSWGVSCVKYCDKSSWALGFERKKFETFSRKFEMCQNRGVRGVLATDPSVPDLSAICCSWRPRRCGILSSSIENSTRIGHTFGLLVVHEARSPPGHEPPIDAPPVLGSVEYRSACDFADHRFRFRGRALADRHTRLLSWRGGCSVYERNREAPIPSTARTRRCRRPCAGRRRTPAGLRSQGSAPPVTAHVATRWPVRAFRAEVGACCHSDLGVAAWVTCGFEHGGAPRGFASSSCKRRGALKCAPASRQGSQGNPHKSRAGNRRWPVAISASIRPKLSAVNLTQVRLPGAFCNAPQ